MSVIEEAKRNDRGAKHMSLWGKNLGRKNQGNTIKDSTAAGLWQFCAVGDSEYQELSIKREEAAPTTF